MDMSLVTLTEIIFFLASRKAFSMASGVSDAFPCPTPTIPFLLPATRATEKLKRRPPAITRVTRLKLTIFWSNSGLIRSRRAGRRPVFCFLLLSPLLSLTLNEEEATWAALSGIAEISVAAAGIIISVSFSIFKNLGRLCVRHRQEQKPYPYKYNRRGQIPL